MMFDQGCKINDIYPWCAENGELGGQEVSITYSDTLSPAGFAFDSLLVRLVKDPQREVCVLSFNRPKRHYEAVFRKNGLDLEALKKAGKFDIYVLDLSSSSSSPFSIRCDDKESGDVINVKSMDYDKCSIKGFSHYWEAAMAWVNSKSLKTSENAALLIDDLEILSLVAQGDRCDKREAMNFLYQIRSIFQSNPNFLLVTMGFDGGVYDDEGDASISEYMKESSTLSISIKPLTSGYSSDCHGIIRVDYGLKVQLYKYKALDSGIRCVEILNSV